MSHSNIRPVTDATFAEVVLKATGPVLVKFEAEWCGPCKAMKPMMEGLADEYDGKVSIVTLNIDENQKIPHQYRVRGLPTVMLFKGGQPVGQKTGLVRATDLVAMINA